MNKYIRVSEDDREYLTTYQEHCEEVAALQDDGYDFEGCILKQADTIEKLCDEIILRTWSNEYQRIEYHRLTSVKEYFLLHVQHDGDEIYGAIWTDKGLIYVAKMNEKGELELL